MKESNNSVNTVLTALIKSIAVSVICAAVLILVFTLAAFSADDPDALVKPLSLIALYISAAVGGFSCIKFCDNGILSGVIAGAALALLVFILSFIPAGTPSGRSTAVTALMYLALIPAGTAGAFLGRKKAKKRPNVRRKIKR